ncbi:hypothetical protein MA16_Dca016950 [Dendrobium catenatum]|uniref:Uncharacterized protein n=1 Tax=Dendrobium catenatum TaxID=906689 RepID=A0A2I0VWJ2_9ASPA|nr:hypothetical protein MA16_Dca016950 [Dendrobium catenatum]
MLDLFFAAALSAMPLTLYLPPLRSLNLFVQTVEIFVRESSGYTSRAIPILSFGFRRILSPLLQIIR